MPNRTRLVAVAVDVVEHRRAAVKSLLEHLLVLAGSDGARVPFEITVEAVWKR
ncbi:unnamed protein product [Ixodes hexagonus]